ncbi:MAG: hypothetical protein QOH45_1397, partial [Pseudonocardiales bacterium]|nr:hypothetical protein [Pseudonocardiales bacterium]
DEDVPVGLTEPPDLADTPSDRP